MMRLFSSMWICRSNGQLVRTPVLTIFFPVKIITWSLSDISTVIGAECLPLDRIIGWWASAIFKDRPCKLGISSNKDLYTCWRYCRLFQGHTQHLTVKSPICLGSQKASKWSPSCFALYFLALRSNYWWSARCWILNLPDRSAKYLVHRLTYSLI